MKALYESTFHKKYYIFMSDLEQNGPYLMKTEITIILELH